MNGRNWQWTEPNRLLLFIKRGVLSLGAPRVMLVTFAFHALSRVSHPLSASSTFDDSKLEQSLSLRRSAPHPTDITLYGLSVSHSLSLPLTPDLVLSAAWRSHQRRHSLSASILSVSGAAEPIICGLTSDSEVRSQIPDSKIFWKIDLITFLFQ